MSSLTNLIYYAAPEIFCVASRGLGISENPHIKKLIHSIENRDRRVEVPKNKSSSYVEYEDYLKERERIKRQESDNIEYVTKRNQRKEKLEIQEFSDLGYYSGSSYSYHCDDE